VTIYLGGIEIRDWEKPESILRGGKQMLAIREFPGGNVSIQNMGPTYRPITWSGQFIGPDAYDRMMTFGLMRTAGEQVTFSADKFSFPVVIEEFLPDYKNDRRIPFSITLRHVVDQRKPIAGLVDAIEEAAAPYAEADAAPQEKLYVVKDGDNLSLIAATEAESKDPNDWEKIYLANLDVLTQGPHRIFPGMELKINV
jgi:hypothetical protein